MAVTVFPSATAFTASITADFGPLRFECSKNFKSDLSYASLFKVHQWLLNPTKIGHPACLVCFGNIMELLIERWIDVCPARLICCMEDETRSRH